MNEARIEAARSPAARLVIDRRAVTRWGRGHPWIFANEILSRPAEDVPPGAVVTLVSPKGEAVGLATFNPHALIACRRLAESPKTVIDAEFFAARLRRADALRRRFLPQPFYRLVHGEADDLPGLVIDRFGDVFVLQLNTAGAEALLPCLLDGLHAACAPAAVVLRRDAPARRLEGLELRPPEVISRLARPVVDVPEGGVTFRADLLGGQKTGWYFDQRRNRALIAGWAQEARVLDLYCHTGGFALRAAAGGARRVLAVDTARPALALAEEAARENGLADQVAFRHGDVRAVLRTLGQEGERFEIVVADPPPFARRARDVPAARRAYARLAHDAARVTAEGGLLALASCSHHVTEETLLEACSRGIRGAGRTARLIHVAGADLDHPLHPALPESRYLHMLFFILD